MLWLDDRLRSHIPHGREFEFVLGLDGEVFRAQKNRRMIRTTVGGRSCFVKTHGPTAWGEIVKNASRGRWPVLTAEPEWKAVQRVGSLGIPTVEPLGFGVRGRFPDRLESFIITAELHNFIHLSDLPPLLTELPIRQQALLTRALIRDVARIARLLHFNGLNHRDFYLNHFMLPTRDWRTWRSGNDLGVHLIDLHRMQIRRKTPWRWKMKDVSGLLFSSLDAGLTSRDCLRFVKGYFADFTPGEWKIWKRYGGNWRSTAVRRAVSLYRSERGRPPPLPVALASFA